MANKGIRDAINAAGIKHWQVADAMGVTDCTFCKWLRKELPPEKQREVMDAIQRVVKQKGVKQ